MNLEKQYRLRVESCIGTIIDVQRTLSAEYEDQSLLDQFEELKEALSDLDLSGVCEGDVLKVEQATNVLLMEFQEFFEHGDIGPVYGTRKV
jgi:hypothetical protein